LLDLVLVGPGQKGSAQGRHERHPFADIKTGAAAIVRVAGNDPENFIPDCRADKCRHAKFVAQGLGGFLCTGKKRLACQGRLPGSEERRASTFRTAWQEARLIRVPFTISESEKPRPGKLARKSMMSALREAASAGLAMAFPNR
jgi:hypothetical protein